jgi:diadenosine tetraphosphatase ApaH/serine/threonine PP2A family protein phosphatase
MPANNIGIYTSTTDDELREMIAPAPAVLAVGHTHQPLIRRIDETLVINAGSVGMPFDGDRRASYGRLQWDEDKGWQAQIIRLHFDYARAEKDYFDTNYLKDAGPLAHLIFNEFTQARGHLNRWGEAYVEDVLKGEITMYESVKWYMERNGMEFTGSLD